MSPFCSSNLLVGPPPGGWGRVSGVDYRHGPPIWQTNSLAARLDFDGFQASAGGPPAVSSHLITQGATVNLSSTQALGTPFDILLNFAPIIPANHVDAFTSANGQIVNIHFIQPGTMFLSSGTFLPAFPAFGGNLSFPFSMGSSATLSAQMIMLDQTHPDGFVLSQACQADFLDCPYVEDLESATVGIPGFYPAGWSDGGGNQPWRVNSGSTVSSNTGPSGDHTLGTGKYIYCETSSPVASGNTFIINMPAVSINGMTNPSCEFSYHMYGATMGSLQLQEFDGAIWNTIWSLSGDQGDVWQLASVPLTAGGSASLRFHYTCGASYTGDAAIDDIRICE